MPVHIVGQNNPECPLCLKPFESAQAQGHLYYFCRKCKIQIMAQDPMLDKQSSIDPETGEAIACSNPACRDKMRIFSRSDGYMKAMCPNNRCGAEIESNQLPDGHYDVRKGEGTMGIESTNSNARKRWKDG